MFECNDKPLIYIKAIYHIFNFYSIQPLSIVLYIFNVIIVVKFFLKYLFLFENTLRIVLEVLVSYDKFIQLLYLVCNFYSS